MKLVPQKPRDPGVAQALVQKLFVFLYLILISFLNLRNPKDEDAASFSPNMRGKEALWVRRSTLPAIS
jgi:hypothetical protein